MKFCFDEFGDVFTKYLFFLFQIIHYTEMEYILFDLTVLHVIEILPTIFSKSLSNISW